MAFLRRLFGWTATLSEELATNDEQTVLVAVHEFGPTNVALFMYGRLGVLFL